MAKKKNATRFPQGVFALEQIEEQYAGQWVLVEETIWNKSGRPLAGRVIAHSEQSALRADFSTAASLSGSPRQPHPWVQIYTLHDRTSRRICIPPCPSSAGARDTIRIYGVILTHSLAVTNCTKCLTFVVATTTSEAGIPIVSA